ncbi:MAG: L-threonylcarbamoyladenylate synthase [Bacillota bacterium]
MAAGGLETLFLKVDGNCPDPEIIRQAGLVLRRGGLVAFPTETVYGLGANALDEAAVRKIFIAKGRPMDNPLILHISDMESIYLYADSVPAKARVLMERFWPGPVTFILRRGGRVPEAVSPGLTGLAFRMPDHPVALALIRVAGVPVAAPSANLSGRPSPTTAEHVRRDLSGRIDMILDGGPAGLGLESTVVDMTGDLPVILRPGGITPEQIMDAVGPVELDRSVEVAGETVKKPRSPGMKYRHYAPSAPLVLVEGDGAPVIAEIKRIALEYIGKGKKVGVICRRENIGQYEGVLAVSAGASNDPASVAASLYGALRYFDDSGVDVILAEGVGNRGLGLAVNNRLRRAAGGKVVRVG